MWAWLDADLVEPPFDETTPIGQRFAWWEVMVERLMSDQGVLCLA